MFDLWQDVRHAFRRLVARPGYTAVIRVTLALAIGATTAVFTVVDETLLRLAPFAFADRLVDMLDRDRARGGGGSSLTPETIVGWQTSPLFERFEGYSPRQFDIAGDGEPERAFGLMVTTRESADAGEWIIANASARPDTNDASAYLTTAGE